MMHGCFGWALKMDQLQLQDRLVNFHIAMEIGLILTKLIGIIISHNMKIKIQISTHLQIEKILLEHGY